MSQELEIDTRKFVEYSMNPNHPDNQGKWMAFATLGYDVQSIQGRNAAAQDVIAQLRQGFATAPSTLVKLLLGVLGLRYESELKD